MAQSEQPRRSRSAAALAADGDRGARSMARSNATEPLSVSRPFVTWSVDEPRSAPPGATPPEAAPFVDGQPAIWSDFARWSSTGLLVVEFGPGRDPLISPIVACNPAAHEMLARRQLVGLALGRAFDACTDPEQRDALQAGLSGWGPQQLRLDHGATTLNVRLHRPPGRVVLALEDAGCTLRLEETLTAQARALDARDRELDALTRGISRRAGRPLNDIRHAIAELRTMSTAGADADTPIEQLSRAADALQQCLDVLFDLADPDVDARTHGSLDVRAIADDVIAGLRPELDALDTRVQLGRLPVVRGVEREFTLLVRMLLLHGLYDRPPGEQRMLCLTSTATRAGWRFTFGEPGCEAGDGPAQMEPSSSDYHLAVCRRILRRRGGRIGRHVDADGRSATWFEWPGHHRRGNAGVEFG